MTPALQLSRRWVDGPVRPGRIGRVALATAASRAPELACEGATGAVEVVTWARDRGQELLFVDGNRFLLEVTARAFRGVGAVCRTAPTPEEALRVLERDARVRVAVLDFELPLGDVGELVWRLRAIRPTIRLVGTSERDRRREFARRGVAHFVPKPWGLAEIVEATGG